MNYVDASKRGKQYGWRIGGIDGIWVRALQYVYLAMFPDLSESTGCPQAEEGVCHNRHFCLQ